MATTLSGSCLCGDVGWEIDGPFAWMAHCHCTMCRKAHGTAFATFVTFPGSSLRWTRGRDGSRRFESSPGFFRAFCGRCGSKLPVSDPCGYAPAGPLVGALGVGPSSHMFVASKAPWYTITDDLQRFDAFPPSASGEPPKSFATPRHTDPAPDRIRGSCLCGAAAYEIDGPLEVGGIVCCHCSRCRRARAAAHGTNLFAAADGFRWLRGDDLVEVFAVEGTRFSQSFCSSCGSPMPRRSPVGDARVIPAGTLDDDPGVRPAIHIMTAFMAPWYAITDDVPRFPEYPAPDGFPPPARARR
jgi:hypothetical protein